jgi:hypothetical protein
MDDKSLMTASFMEFQNFECGHLFPGRQYVQKKQTFGVFRHGFYNSVIDELADRAGVGAGESDHGIGHER